MKTHRMATMVALALSLACFGVRGQGGVPESLNRIAPFTDAYTVGVARVDLEGLKVQDWVDLVLGALPEERAKADEAMAPFAQALQTWQSRFVDAGAKELYLILSLSYLSAEPPALLVVPVATGGNAERVHGLVRELVEKWKGECRIVETCVVAAPSSVWQAMDSLGERHPPEQLRAAFAGAAPGFVQVLFLTYPEAERVLEEMLPTLPEVLRGGPSASALGQSTWVALSLTGSSDAILQLIVQFEHSLDAETVGKLWGRGLAALGASEPVRKRLPDWDVIQTALTPEVAGQTLQLRLSQSRITKLLQQVAPSTMRQTEERAARVAVMNNLKQVALAMHLYSADHQNRFPEHLADALPYLGSARPLLLPDSSVSLPENLLQQDRAAQVAWVDQNTDFIYALPGASVKSVENPARKVLAYQKPETSPRGSLGVAFADGHVEMMTREDLEPLLK